MSEQTKHQVRPHRAREVAQTAMGYSRAFDGKSIDWQSSEPWPRRMDLAQALDWITELGQMVLDLAGRVEAGACRSASGDCTTHRVEPAAEAPEAHQDDAAVDEFAVRLKAKLAQARAKGRRGWRDPSWAAADINRQMHEHAAKGDPLDVAAYAMFLALRGESTTAPAQAASKFDWQQAVYSLMGYSVVEKGAGKEDMPRFFMELAEAIAREHLDESHAERVLTVAKAQRIIK